MKTIITLSIFLFLCGFVVCDAAIAGKASEITQHFVKWQFGAQKKLQKKITLNLIAECATLTSDMMGIRNNVLYSASSSAGRLVGMPARMLDRFGNPMQILGLGGMSLGNLKTNYTNLFGAYKRRFLAAAKGRLLDELTLLRERFLNMRRHNVASSMKTTSDVMKEIEQGPAEDGDKIKKDVKRSGQIKAIQTLTNAMITQQRALQLFEQALMAKIQMDSNDEAFDVDAHREAMKQDEKKMKEVEKYIQSISTSNGGSI